MKAKRAKTTAANINGRANHTQLGGSTVAANKNVPARPTAKLYLPTCP
jgi:hypothetical protein